MPQITLNGQMETIPPDTTMTDLLRQTEARFKIALAAPVAVEINQRIIRRADWPTTVIQPGDRVDIIQLVGGG